MAYIFSLSSALCFSLAWHLPDTFFSVILGWLGSFTLIPLIYKQNYKAAFLHSTTCFAIGSYWIYGTISEFGNFNSIISFTLFLLFVLSHGLQAPISIFIFKILPIKLESFGMRASFAWIAGSYLPIRLFPWEIAHTQLKFSELIQVSDIAGSLLVSLIVLSVSESITLLVLYKKKSSKLILPLIIFVISFIYGNYQIENYLNIKSKKLTVNVVQANINVIEKNNMKYFESNFEKYKILTKLGISENEENLIVWPESVYNDWIPENLRDSNQMPILPKLGDRSALIFGALSFRDRNTFFNSAVAIYPSSYMPIPNHKKILMPFGEYVPLAKTFPWLNQLHPFGAGFTPGIKTNLFKIPFKETRPVVGTLICYEDLIPGLARVATVKGANLLVNLTNDAWFGKTIAARQHHAIAAFRAVENKRTLVRSTNSGFTSIINPLGRTLSYIPEFSEEILSEKVILNDEKTIFTTYLGNYLWFLLLLYIFCILITKLYKSLDR